MSAGTWTRDVLAVALGGAAGTLLRAGVHLLRPQQVDGFPWTTLGENLLGAFLMGLVAALLLRRLGRDGPTVWERRGQLFLTTGLLGSFTTFSALAVEGAALLRAGIPLIAVGYLGTSLVFGPILALAGLRLGAGPGSSTAASRALPTGEAPPRSPVSAASPPEDATSGAVRPSAKRRRATRRGS